MIDVTIVNVVGVESVRGRPERHLLAEAGVDQVTQGIRHFLHGPRGVIDKIVKGAHMHP